MAQREEQGLRVQPIRKRVARNETSMSSWPAADDLAADPTALLKFVLHHKSTLFQMHEKTKYIQVHDNNTDCPPMEPKQLIKINIYVLLLPAPSGHVRQQIP